LPETEMLTWQGLWCLINTNIALNCVAYCQLSYVYLVRRSFGSWLCPNYHYGVLSSLRQFYTSFLPRKPGFSPRWLDIRFWMAKVTMGHNFLWVSLFLHF
jgi:hypothetical protein